MKILWTKEKILALTGTLALALFVVVGYAQAPATGSSMRFVAQEPVKTDEETKTVDQTKDQENNLKNRQTELKDKRREVEQISKELKGALDVSAANALSQKLESCLAARQGEVGTDAFWNNLSDCSALFMDFEDELNNNLRPQRDCNNYKRSLTDRKRERKNLDQQIKEILRNDKTTDVSALQGFVTQIDAQIAKGDGAAANAVCTIENRDTLNDVQSDLNPLFQDFYNLSNDVREISNLARRKTENTKDFEKNISRQCEKDKSRQLKEYEKQYERAQKKGDLSVDQQAAYAKVKDIYTQSCVTLLEAMRNALAAGDMDAFESARSDYWAIDRDFWDTLNESRGSLQEEEQRVEQIKNVTRDLQQKSKDIVRMKRNLQRTKRLYDRTAKKYADKDERKEALAEFARFISQAEELVAKIEAGLEAAKQEAASDPDAYWFERNEELNELREEFEELQQETQNIANVMQTLKGVEKVLRFTARDIKKIRRESGNDAELIGKLEAIRAQVSDAVRESWSLAITSPEEALETIQSVFSLQEDWNDAVEDWRDARDEE